MSEATPEFKQQLREAFDAIQVGQTFTFRRTFTEGEVALFCGVTGDYNPYHIDETFAQNNFFGRRNIPGLLTGIMITHIGDTITCTVTFAEKDAQKRLLKATGPFVNQHGVEVLRARFSGFPANVRLAR
jgi:3-hydroxybutyryl-CoA dehydratase